MPAAQSTSEQGADARWARRTLGRLSLEEKIGQLLCPRLPATFDAGRWRYWSEQVAAGRVGCFVLFAGDAVTTAQLTSHLQSLSPQPLLFASDYEWGTAMRLGGGTRFPRAMAFGAGGTVADIEIEARTVAREARAVGVHLILAPVLDLATNRANPVINSRSFGADPHRVAELGTRFVEVLQANGVLAVAKHFPGHGGTDEDSHQDLPTDASPRDQLEQRELIPFARAIDAGIAAVMPAHVFYPGLDTSVAARPATLSRPILHQLLRRQLGHHGLIVSDALEMAGARTTSWDGRIAADAFAAGVDLLLVPPRPAVARDSLRRAVERGEITAEELDRRVLRVLEAKARVGLHHRARRAPDTRLLDSLLRELETDRAAAASIAERAVTLVSADDGLLPLPSRAPPRILLLHLAAGSSSRAEELVQALERRSTDVEAHPLRVAEAARGLPSVLEAVPSAELVLVTTDVSATSPAAELLQEISGTVSEAAARHHRPLVLISLNDPWILETWPAANGRMVSYDSSPASQLAVARALFGEIAIAGRLPVSLAGAPIGSGLQRPASYHPLAPAPPSELGLSAERLERAAAVVEQAVEAGVAPGASLVVARRGRIALERAYGHQTYDRHRPIDSDSIFDLASLTKVVVTTTLVMLAHETGTVELDAPAALYIPELAGEDARRGTITVRDLLTHTSGLPCCSYFFKERAPRQDPDAWHDLVRSVAATPLAYEPRTDTMYSDLGFLLLGEILQRARARSIEHQARAELFQPLGLQSMGFRPDRELRPKIAPTELDTSWRQTLVHGQVHDENAWSVGGVSSHAGLFSNARDLAVFAQMLLNGGVYDGRRVVSGSTVRLFTRRAGVVEGSSRALGWDTPSQPSSAGRFFSASSFGHTGFTGTSLWIDPEQELVVVLLTNRVHPSRENRRISELRPAFHDAVAAAILDTPPAPRDGTGR